MKYSKETKDYIKSVEDYLSKEYGEIKPEWGLMLNMLKDNYQQYLNCLESIEQNGIYSPESGKKNPLLSTVKDLQASIYKIVQHLGISPYAKSKIRTMAEDDTDDFIDTLTGGDDDQK